MDSPELLQPNKNRHLADIPWEEFPEELKVACWKFINRWFEETPMDDLRELSGFDDMSLEDVLKPPRSG